ncbi:hypothetical protein QR685DRAFT_600662 [Neurospora intermedia]|uniref:Uncharacterized protein n=1 Tax=Neurospora intermedia TaxID=5142 RepID=A0ABR3D3P6_NEUIN
MVKVKVSLDRSAKKKTWMSCECYGVRNPSIRTKHSGCNVEYVSSAQQKSRFHSDCRGLELELEMEMDHYHLPATARHGDHMGNVISTPTHRPNKQRQRCLGGYRKHTKKYYPTRRRIPNGKTKMPRRLVLTSSSIRHAHELTVRARQGLGETDLLMDTTQAGLTQATRTHIHYLISAL